MLVKEPTQKRIDPRIQRTRQLLQQALVELVAEKGFQAITVQDITHRARINRATFYAHFVDKFDLLEYNMREMFREAVRQKLADDAPFSLENLQNLLLVLGQVVSQLHHHCIPSDKQFENLAENQIKSQLYEIFTRWFKVSQENSGAAAVPADLWAMMTSWAVYGAMRQWVQKEQPEPLPVFVQKVLPIILGNFQPL